MIWSDGRIAKASMLSELHNDGTKGLENCDMMDCTWRPRGKGGTRNLQISQVLRIKNNSMVIGAIK